MIDKRIKEDCPFCGEKKENIQITTLGNSKNHLNRLYCPKCECEFRDTNKQKLIDRWNCRI